MTGQFAAVLRLEATRSVRHGMVAATVVVTAAWGALLVALPAEVAAAVLPMVLYLDAAIVGLLFVGGSILVERRDGVLEALAVSPLRPASYLAAKVVTLTGLALATSLVLTLIATPPARSVDLATIVAGVVLLSVPVLLIAVGIAAQSTTVAGYLLGLQIPLLPAVAPLAVLAGWLPAPLGWASPTTGPFRLLAAGAAGTDLPAPVAVAAVLVPVITSVLLARWAVTRVRVDLLRSGRLT